MSDRIEHYRAVQGLNRCEWLAVDCSTNYIEQCVLLARSLGIISAEPVPIPTNSRSHLTSIAGDLDTFVVPTNPGSELPASPPHQPDGTTKPYAVIEVELPSEVKFATARLEIHERDRVKKWETEPLNLNPSAVNELVKESQALKDRLSKALQDPRKRRYRERWQADYRALGERVSSLLWTTSFNSLYHVGLGAADGNVRLRFSLEQPWFDGLWEAIFDALGQRFLMLDKTITRRARLRNSMGVFANVADEPKDFVNRIGARDGTLKVLVINSNVPDASAPDGPDDLLWRRYWESLKAQLPKLPHLEDEVKVVRELRQAVRGRNNRSNAPHREIEVDVLPLRTPDKPWSLAELVEQKLKNPSRRYDIVHFAGHALFATSAKRTTGEVTLSFRVIRNPEPCRSRL